jgi:hypothetical protein
MDWKSWHENYNDPNRALARRLATVQDRIRAALDVAAPGPLRAISLCAGQGRDLIPVLAEHPRGRDVRARLVELDPQLAEDARRAAAAAGLDGVQVVTGDAALTDHYLADDAPRGGHLALIPADLVLVCGLYGNITPADIERTVAACAALCATGGTVVWTRGRNPDQTVVPQICAWYEQHGFEQLWLEDPEVMLCVGAHRYTGVPRPLPAGERLFEFIGYDRLNADRSSAR